MITTVSDSQSIVQERPFNHGLCLYRVIYSAQAENENFLKFNSYGRWLFRVFAKFSHAVYHVRY